MSEKKIKSCMEKILDITEDMQKGVKKKGKNHGQGYAFVKGEVAMQEFRQLEIKHKIKVLPTAIPETIRVIEKPGKGFITTCAVTYKIFNVEDPRDLYMVTLIGQGYDMTDKGSNKALTSAFKYFILQTFSFSADDVEKDSPGVSQFNPK